MEGPHPLTEQRLQAYIVYKKDVHGVIKQYMQEMAKVAKQVDGKSNQLTKTVAAVQGMFPLQEKQEVALQATRKKYGFEENEDNRLWEAIADVVAAKAIELLAVEASAKMYRDLQANGGDQKKAGDEFFQNLEATEKEGMEKARAKYGAVYVDVLSKHVKELHALQMDATQAVTGALTSEK